MSLAEESEARKARLLALRNKKAGLEDEGPAFVFKQRNFDPETRTLKKSAPDQEEDDTVEKTVHGLADKIIAEDEERRGQELDLFNMAPKRPNWDLKREMERKLIPLERKTQEAIFTLIRRRLGGPAGGLPEDLIGAMNAQLEAAVEDDDE